MSRPRIAVACLFHESNTAIVAPTTLGDANGGRIEPDAMLAAIAGTQTAAGGFVDGGRERGFELVPLVYYRLVPSGRVARDAFEAMAREFEETLRRAGPLDGLLLELHGAMTAVGYTAADADLARRARAALRSAPVVAVIDPHANVSPGLVEAVDALLAYQSNPHVDMADRGRDGVEILAALLRREARPAIAARRIPIVAPAIAQATADEPLATVVGAARGLEREDPGILAASVAFGFAYADVPDLGMTAIVVADEPARAGRAADELAARSWELRERFRRDLCGPEDAIARAFRRGGRVALADTGDNIGGGAPGDSSTLAAAALTHGGIRAATTICDPVAVEAAAAAGVGADVALELGVPPLAVTARVRDIRTGRFVAQGPLYAGLEFDMGRVAILEIGRLTIVAQTRAVPANDQNLFKSLGVDLDAVDAILLKGAAAIRAGWRSAADEFLDVATPGPTTSDVHELRLRCASRPLWPLDDFEWDPTGVVGRSRTRR
jgi:microcystin degradation protein MlrC